MSLGTRKIAVTVFAAAVLFWLVVEIAFYDGPDGAAPIIREIVLVALAAFLVVRTWRPISRR
jgi:hypothetical protein